MDNRVIYRTGKAALEAGIAVLRFNFRGVGASTGSYDEGIGEQDDVAAAIDWLAARYPGLPLALAGFSFGAWVGLRVADRDPRIGAMVGLAPPMRFYDFDFLMGNRKPTLLVAGSRDEFCPHELMDRLASKLPASTALRWIEGADHFFSKKLPQAQDLVTTFLREWHVGE
jgi:alpha/beta superfamily hydrolase